MEPALRSRIKVQSKRHGGVSGYPILPSRSTGSFFRKQDHKNACLEAIGIERLLLSAYLHELR